MTNTGEAPDVPRCDLKFRGSHIRRNTEPGKRRWKPWPDGLCGFDIVAWMPSED